MKILVCIKRVIDYTLRIRIRPDLTGVDSTNMKMVMNPFDEIAVEEAVRWKEQGKASEVVLVSIGPTQSADTLRTGLAMGADRALHIRTDDTLEALTLARCLHAVVQQEAPQLVFLGKQAVDDDRCQTGQMLAALLGWGQGTFASRIELKENAIEVTREIDNGKEVVAIDLPAVVTADLLLNEPRYASLPNIMKAKKKPLQEINLEELGIDVSPQLKVVKVSEPAPRQAGQRVQSVRELMDNLNALEKLG